MLEPKNVAGVVIFLVWRQQFFMILRDDDPKILFPNKWCPVTGGREENEDLQEAALRELQEEIGFVPLDLVTLGVSMKGNAFFFGRLSDEEKASVVLGEGQGFDFYTYEQLSTLDIGGAMLKYLQNYPDVFKEMAETGKPPYGRELGLATWNGNK